MHDYQNFSTTEDGKATGVAWFLECGALRRTGEDPCSRQFITVQPIVIKKHIQQGSSIISDGWRSYHHLQDEGYSHITGNHKECFVDPITGAPAQNLERLWGICKSTIWRLRGNRTQNVLKDHLDVIEWSGVVWRPTQTWTTGHAFA